MIATDIRLIDRQVDPSTFSILEVYAGPDNRRVRFLADRWSARSEVWTPAGWTEVHRLKGTIPPPEEALRRLFGPTEDILGWSTPNG